MTKCGVCCLSSIITKNVKHSVSDPIVLQVCDNCGLQLIAMGYVDVTSPPQATYPMPSQGYTSNPMPYGTGSIGQVGRRCTICMSSFWGSTTDLACNTCLQSLAQFTGSHKDIRAQGDKISKQIKDECECGNKDKPMYTQQHSQWCKGYKQEFT